MYLNIPLNGHFLILYSLIESSKDNSVSWRSDHVKNTF